MRKKTLLRRDAYEPLQHVALQHGKAQVFDLHGSNGLLRDAG